MGPTLTILMLAQGLVVETPSPDALCPDLARTRETVRNRLGEVQGAGYRASYTIVHERGDSPKDFVKLELIDPVGTVRLRRELPIGNSCGAVADAIALVLERYFRTLVDGEVEPKPGRAQPSNDGLAAPDPGVAAPAESAGSANAGLALHAGSDGARGASTPAGAVPGDAPSAETPADTDAADDELALIVHGGVHSYALGPAAALRLETSLDAWLGMSWSIAVPFEAREESLADDRWAQASALDARWTLTWGRHIGVFRPFIGAGVHALAERGSAGGLEESSAQHRMAIGPCVEAGWRFDIGDGWLANVVGSVGWPLASTGRFIVDGDETLTLNDEIAFAGLGVGRSFSF